MVNAEYIYTLAFHQSSLELRLREWPRKGKAPSQVTSWMAMGFPHRQVGMIEGLSSLSQVLVTATPQT